MSSSGVKCASHQCSIWQQSLTSQDRLSRVETRLSALRPKHASLSTNHEFNRKRADHHTIIICMCRSIERKAKEYRLQLKKKIVNSKQETLDKTYTHFGQHCTQAQKHNHIDDPGANHSWTVYTQYASGIETQELKPLTVNWIDEKLMKKKI